MLYKIFVFIHITAKNLSSSVSWDLSEINVQSLCASLTLLTQSVPEQTATETLETIRQDDKQPQEGGLST